MILHFNAINFGPYKGGKREVESKTSACSYMGDKDVCHSGLVMQ